MKFYLIQRGTFKKTNLEDIQGLDTCIEYDYMGSSEFEWGALPKSLKRIVKERRENPNLCVALISINSLPFWLYSKSISDEEIKQIEYLFNNSSKVNLIERLNIDAYFEGEKIERLKRNCKKKREVVDNWDYCDFWWDLENDWMVIPYAPYYTERLNKAFQKLEERGFGKE